MGRDRRRYPRVGVALDVTIEAAGSRWQGIALKGMIWRREPKSTVA